MGRGAECIGELSVLSQFCCGPKTTLKNKFKYEKARNIKTQLKETGYPVRNSNIYLIDF